MVVELFPVLVSLYMATVAVPEVSLLSNGKFEIDVHARPMARRLAASGGHHLGEGRRRAFPPSAFVRSRGKWCSCIAASNLPAPPPGGGGDPPAFALRRRQAGREEVVRCAGHGPFQEPGRQGLEARAGNAHLPRQLGRLDRPHVFGRRFRSAPRISRSCRACSSPPAARWTSRGARFSAATAEQWADSQPKIVPSRDARPGQSSRPCRRNCTSPAINSERPTARRSGSRDSALTAWNGRRSARSSQSRSPWRSTSGRPT